MSADRPSRRPATAAHATAAGKGWACLLAAFVAAVVSQVVPVSPARDVVAVVSGRPRTVEARLTGGFPFAPLAAPSRSAGESADWRVLAVAGKARETSETLPTPANLQVLGVAALQAARFDAAVQALEDAAVADATNATIQSDLSAAYLARGGQPGHAADLARALDAADRAHRLNPRLGPAAFNYALTLERLHLRHEAARAWARYAEDFSDDVGWADEARRRREALAVAPPRLPPSPASQADARLGEWAAVAVADPAGAVLPDLAPFGRFHAAIADAITASDAPARRALAVSVRDLLAAEVALAAPDYGLADRLAAGVESRHVQPDSPLRLWAVRLRLTTGFNTGTARDQRRVAEDLAVAARRLGFDALHSDARHRLGALDFVSGAYERAYGHYQEALGLRESLRNTRAAVSSRIAAADALRMLGREPEAWERYVANLRAGALGDPLLENARLTAPGAAEIRDGRPSVGLAFAREVEHHAVAIGQQGMRAYALVLQGRALWQSGEPAAASDAIRRARQALDAHHDVTIRDRYLAEVVQAEAEVLSTTAPLAAVPVIADAEARLKTNAGQRLVALAVLEARVHRVLGDLDRARAALHKGVALVDTQQRQIAQADFLPSFLDASWDVFSEFVDLEASAGDHEAALQWLDRGFDIRRRWRGGASSLPLAEASRRGPVVTYLARPDALWMWVVRDGAVSARRIPVSRDELARRAARLAHVLTLDTAPTIVDEAVTDIARDVWWPVASLLDRGGEAPSRIALVLDPVLQSVPFALLPWNASGDTRVVDRTATVLCPSLFACRAADAVGAAAARVAALHAGQGGNGFAALPAARDEAERIGRRYAGADVAAATEAAFVAALTTADVLHFSGHAVPDERYPGRSELLLATEAGEGVRVPLGRLLERPVRTALIVLSACRTSRAEARRGEGGIGVAGEFLRAGVPQVLATQWDVKDDVAGMVMDHVHEALASGATPWDAVRHAQRIVGRDAARHPRDWAGYVAYTSVSLR